MEKDKNGHFLSPTRDGVLVKINREGSMIEIPNEGTISFDAIAGASVVLRNHNGEIRCLADVPESSSPCSWTFTCNGIHSISDKMSLEYLIEQERVELNGRY